MGFKNDRRKKISEYKEIIKTPLVVLVGWALVSAAIGICLLFMMYDSVSTETDGAMAKDVGVVKGFATSLIAFGISWVVLVLGILIAIGSYTYTGWSAVKKYNGNLATGVIAGALLGLTAGLTSGVIGIVELLIHLTMIPQTIPMSDGFGPVGAEISTVMAGAMDGISIAFAIFSGLIVGPVVSLIVGSIVSLIGSLAAGAKEFK